MSKHRGSRARHGDKDRTIGHVKRTPGSFAYVTAGGAVKEMLPPRRRSRYGDKRRKASRRGSRRR